MLFLDENRKRRRKEWLVIMNKKFFWISIGVLIIAIIVVGVYLWIQNTEKTQENEIEPEAEITEEQMRQTIVTLYYQNKDTKELMPEGRTIDAKELLTDPYGTLVNLLIETPKNEKLQSAIPEGTRVLKTELQGNIVYVDLSKEFIDNHPGGKEQENATIYSIVNTLTGLNEVEGVKILINGKENQCFKDEEISFREAFMRIENTQKNSTKENNIESNNIIDNTTNTQ